MHYVKIETSAGETRWINLARVSRVTTVKETGSDEEILVLMFADGSSDCTLRLHADDERDRAAITVLRANLDALAAEACTV
jgi:hypothetical protein